VAQGPRGVDPGGWRGLDPLKICRRGQSMFWPSPRKMSHFFHSKLLFDNSASFTSSRMKDLWVLCQKWKVKLILLRWLEQFDGLIWLTPTPIFHDIYATDLEWPWKVISDTEQLEGQYLEKVNSIIISSIKLTTRSLLGRKVFIGSSMLQDLWGAGGARSELPVSVFGSGTSVWGSGT